MNRRIEAVVNVLHTVTTIHTHQICKADINIVIRNKPVNDVVLVFLLLTLNIFQTFF